MTTYRTSVAVRMSATKVTGSPALNLPRSSSTKSSLSSSPYRLLQKWRPAPARVEILKEATRAPRNLELREGAALERPYGSDPWDLPVSEHGLDFTTGPPHAAGPA